MTNLPRCARCHRHAASGIWRVDEIGKDPKLQLLCAECGLCTIPARAKMHTQLMHSLGDASHQEAPSCYGKFSALAEALRVHGKIFITLRCVSCSYETSVNVNDAFGWINFGHEHSNFNHPENVKLRTKRASDLAFAAQREAGTTRGSNDAKGT